MQLPLDILDEIGQTYGPTRKLHQALANLVAATIVNLERSKHGTAYQLPSYPSSGPLPPLMPLPLRIDPSLQFDNTLREGALQSSTKVSALSTPGVSQPNIVVAASPAGGWQDPLGNASLQPNENEAFPHGIANRQMASDSGRAYSGDIFNGSNLWGPSLEWTGGWDDFL